MCLFAASSNNWRVPSIDLPNIYIMSGDGRFDVGRIVDKYDSAQLGELEGRMFDMYVTPPYQSAVESILTNAKLVKFGTLPKSRIQLK